MYEVTLMFGGDIEESQNCDTLEEAIKVLEEWMQEDLKVLTSSSPRDIEEMTFKIEKKEVVFSVTY